MSVGSFHLAQNDLMGLVTISDPDNTHLLELSLRPNFGFFSINATRQTDIIGEYEVSLESKGYEKQTKTASVTEGNDLGELHQRRDEDV